MLCRFIIQYPKTDQMLDGVDLIQYPKTDQNARWGWTIALGREGKVGRMLNRAQQPPHSPTYPAEPNHTEMTTMILLCFKGM